MTICGHRAQVWSKHWAPLLAPAARRWSNCNQCYTTKPCFGANYGLRESAALRYFTDLLCFPSQDGRRVQSTEKTFPLLARLEGPDAAGATGSVDLVG